MFQSTLDRWQPADGASAKTDQDAARANDQRTDAMCAMLDVSANRRCSDVGAVRKTVLHAVLANLSVCQFSRHDLVDSTGEAAVLRVLARNEATTEMLAFASAKRLCATINPAAFVALCALELGVLHAEVVCCLLPAPSPPPQARCGDDLSLPVLKAEAWREEKKGRPNIGRRGV